MEAKGITIDFTGCPGEMGDGLVCLDDCSTEFTVHQYLGDKRREIKISINEDGSISYTAKTLYPGEDY